MRFCPNCGTEVDESAAFCPTCGQAIDQAAETAMPAAPAWPEPAASPPADQPEARTAAPAAVDPAATQERQPVPTQAPPPATPPPPAEATGPTVDVPVTMPVTLSAWLIGVGALLGALGVVIGLFDGPLNLIELLLLLALIGVAVAVFFADAVAGVPNLRLATLVVSVIGFGIALDRLGIGGAGVGELLLFLGTAMAAIGAIILELGRDQPLGPSR